jgi:nitrite reductase/ring-hydroxylating ferredoxin subunit
MALRVKVCKLGDVVDDELRAFKVRGVTWPVIVTRVEGELFACQGACPHEDVELADGYLFGTTIICPAHAYQYDLRSGTCRHDKTLNLRRYPITIDGDDVLVDLM